MLPLRQQILLGLTIVSGICLIICSVFNLLPGKTLNTAVLLHGMGVPFLLLMFDTVIDLNDKTIFRIWLAIAFLTYGVSLTTFDDPKFLFLHGDNSDTISSPHRWLSNYSTSSAKALLVFLLSYWVLNKIIFKRGLFLVNTFQQTGWYHDVVGRRITGLDVTVNIVLYILIIIAGLFGR